jgi:tRNA pseudouridine55 synthase
MNDPTTDAPPRAKRRQGEQRRSTRVEVNGWVCLDKPVGLTSTQAVAQVKYLFNAKKAGHAGTLDPLASGVLPIALGEATKTVPIVQDGVKIYRFGVKWGEETDTDDAEGRVVASSGARPEREAILRLLPKFIGAISQVPPTYSAIKIAGERAYDLARDLGRLLGCYAHVVMLRRTRVGPFTSEGAVTPEALRAGPAEPPQALLPVEAGLAELPCIPLDRDGAAMLRRGQKLLLRGAHAPSEGPAYATCFGTPIAFGVVEGGYFTSTRVFNMAR